MRFLLLVGWDREAVRRGAGSSLRGPCRLRPPPPAALWFGKDAVVAWDPAMTPWLIE